MPIRLNASPYAVDELRSLKNPQSQAIPSMIKSSPVSFSELQLQGGEKLIRLPELLRTIGVSRATAYRYMGSGRLPKPIKLSSRFVAWKASAINEWLAHLQAGQN